MARKEIQNITVERFFDTNADSSYLEQEGFEERLDQYKRGVFSYIGIGAKAEIVIDGVCETITSGGLWGIEDDSDRDYIKEIEQEQISELASILGKLGFSQRAINKAVAA